MAKEEREKKMFVGVAWNCAAELKFLITALLFVCSLATVLQFLPSRFSFSSAADIRLCVSNVSAAVAAEAASPPQNPPPPHQQDEVLESGVIKRSFKPYGAAAYNFVLMSAYRGGLNTFAVMGLSSKPLHVFGKASYQCQWVPHNATASPAAAVAGIKILPDWGYGRVYTVVVVNCTFPSPIGHDGSGGKLLLLASTNGGGDRNLNLTDTVEALIEPPGSVNLSLYSSPPKYDYLYCGSSLYGNLSPERVREWLAYHVRLFGERSHFVIHDAGGIHAPVMEVLRPWIEKGYVTLHDIRDQERFDGYYHNQFLIVNDCLHRYRFDAKWMFFFDVDEFIFVPRKSTIKSVTDSLSDHTQFTIEQMTMSNKLCLSEDAGKSFRKWGFEKLVYRDVKRGIRRDRKYAVQPRNVFATGVHMSQNFAGKSTYKTEGRIKYYHYHGTISERREPCRQFLNATTTTVDGIPYVMDTTMRGVAPSVKRFELKMIGPRLQKTHQ
ncbi:Galactan beta-1,4-galactosyltransferase [Actinidia chinensis var. chinensis]|uniref:Glycosyltransferase family 92 protein n=1 Tax=Actinidia chinensis var. chinensis TaxID=1590841 RepID=A0A2R6QAP2_ACTCC|nr:Galactan beta-1,4-galactosyltransferase [Actinidia chinensis var. chinensis]